MLNFTYLDIYAIYIRSMCSFQNREAKNKYIAIYLSLDVFRTSILCDRQLLYYIIQAVRQAFVFFSQVSCEILSAICRHK